MHTLSLLIQMSLITTKIIHIFSSDANISEATTHKSGRINFGEEVWRCIIRQAVQKMTEHENFLPIIQKIWDFGKIDGTNIGPFVEHVLSAMDDYISAELNVEKSYLKQTKNLNNDWLQLIIVSTNLLMARKYIYNSDRIAEWHDFGPIVEFPPFKRLLLCEEILFQKISNFEDLLSKNRKNITTDNEISMYGKLEKYLKKDCKDLWELYRSNQSVSGFNIDVLDIMLNDGVSKKLVEYLNHKDNENCTIVSIYEERETTLNLLSHRLGVYKFEEFFCFTISTLDSVLKLINIPENNKNFVEFGNKIKNKIKQSMVFINNRCHNKKQDIFSCSDVLGNVSEQEIWNEIRKKMHSLLSTAFKAK